MTLEQVCNMYTKAAELYGHSQVTIYDYAREFRRFNEYGTELYGDAWDLSKATALNVQNYMRDALERGQSPATVNRSRNALSSLYNVLKVAGVVSFNPVEPIGRIRRIRNRRRLFLTEPDAKEFFAQISHPVYRLAARMIFYTGLRVTELTTLSASHVNLDAGIVKVVGKGRKEREIPIHQTELLPHLVKHRDAYLRDCDPYSRFFQTETLKEISPDVLNRALKQVSKELGLSYPVTCHVLRHSFATDYLYKGGLLHELQELLGHERLETTALYLHVVMEAVRQVIQSSKDKAAGSGQPMPATGSSISSPTQH